jgi:hypothetical protein
VLPLTIMIISRDCFGWSPMPGGLATGPSSGVTGMALVCFSGHPHKAMRLDNDTNNFSAGVENREDFSQVHDF